MHVRKIFKRIDQYFHQNNLYFRFDYDAIFCLLSAERSGWYGNGVYVFRFLKKILVGIEINLIKHSHKIIAKKVILYIKFLDKTSISGMDN